MKLRPKRKLDIPNTQPQIPPEKEGKKPRKSPKGNKLPKDEYAPLLQPQRIIVRETQSTKDPTKEVKQYIEFSVKRFGEDLENSPSVYLQMYQESEFYTGYLKGHSVSFTLENLYEVIDQLTSLGEECEKNGIE